MYHENTLLFIEVPCIISTFLIDNLYTTILFDSSADRNFITPSFKQLFNNESSKLHIAYEVEVANSQIENTNESLRNCLLTLNDHTFYVNLMPMNIGSFDLIIGMDWLSLHRAKIICFEKFVQLTLPYREALIIYGDKSSQNMKLISCTNAQKYIHKKYYAFLVHVVDKARKRKEIKDIPHICDYLDVFPKDLPGLPLSRCVEFRIDLILGANPVARSSYRLALSEMQELSSQLQELIDKGFIRPSFSSWGSPILFVKK